MFEQIKDILSRSRQIAIVSHRNPDGDAYGSSLGLLHFLKKMGHKVNFVTPNDCPNFLKWMPGQSEIVIFEEQTVTAKEILQKAEIIFTLDFNNLSRIGDLEPLIKNSKATKIMIDHHESPSDYATLMYSDPSMSSTCEMVYHLINKLNKNAFTSEISNCLYTGIMTDTGSFRYPATTPKTHKAIAHLIEAGASSSNIHEKIYDSASFSRLKLLGITLSNMKKIQNLPIVYMTLSQEELNTCNYKKGDTEGFVNYGLSIEGAQMTLFMREEEGVVKLSLRSKGIIDVNEIARASFNGGGHKNAAGGKLEMALPEALAYAKKVFVWD